MRHRPLALSLAALAVLPHELAHALVARAAGLSVEVTLLPAWDGEGTPLGRFDAVLAPTTPTWVVRLVAVAPWPVFVGLAAILDAVATLPRPAALVAVPLLSLWASLSAGDLAVAGRPAAARAAGQFVAPGAAWADRGADALTLATVGLVALLLLT